MVRRVVSVVVAGPRQIHNDPVRVRRIEIDSLNPVKAFPFSVVVPGRVFKQLLAGEHVVVRTVEADGVGAIAADDRKP